MEQGVTSFPDGFASSSQSFVKAWRTCRGLAPNGLSGYRSALTARVPSIAYLAFVAVRQHPAVDGGV